MKNIGIILLICFCIIGCVEFKEEVWLNYDGSGRLKLTIEMSEQFLNMSDPKGAFYHKKAGLIVNFIKKIQNSKEKIEKQPEVKEVFFENYKKDNVMYYIFDIKVKDIKEIGKIYKKIFEPSKIDEEGFVLNQNITIKKLKDDGNMIISCLFQRPPGKNESGMLNFLTSGKNFTVKLYLPKLISVISTNGKLDKEKNITEWQIPLSELMSSKGFNKELKVEINIPNIALWVISFLCIIFLIIIIIYILIKRKKLNFNMHKSKK